MKRGSGGVALFNFGTLSVAHKGTQRSKSNLNNISDVYKTGKLVRLTLLV